MTPSRSTPPTPAGRSRTRRRPRPVSNAAPRPVSRRPRRRQRPAGAGAVVRLFLITAGFAAVAALHLATFLIQPTTVATSSMHTPPERRLDDPPGGLMGNFNLLVGDILLIDRLTIPAQRHALSRAIGLGHAPRRGELVWLRDPDHPDQRVVKRVVGLPGESIRIRAGVVFLDGRRLHEPYAYHALGTANDDGSRDMSPLTLSADQYFLMGDNRDFSRDSRAWGPVPSARLVGKPLVILWSLPDDETLAHTFPERQLAGPHQLDHPGDRLAFHWQRLRNVWRTRWGRVLQPVRRAPWALEGLPWN